MFILHSFTSSLIHAQCCLLFFYNKCGWFLDNLIGRRVFVMFPLSNVFLEVKIFLFSSNFQLFPFGCYYHLFFLCFNWKSRQAKMSFQGMEVGVPVRGYNISTWWLPASRQEKGDLILFSWHFQLVLRWNSGTGN